MNSQNYIEQLENLAAGAKIMVSGKVCTVLEINYQDKKGKFRRTDIAYLEDGKPAKYERMGVFGNAGKVLTVSNTEWRTVYARPSSFKDFAIL